MYYESLPEMAFRMMASGIYLTGIFAGGFLHG